MSELKWDGWIHGSLLSTERKPNRNMLGASAQAVFLLDTGKITGGTDLAVLNRMYLEIRRYELRPGVFFNPTTMPSEDIRIDDYLSLACVGPDIARRILGRLKSRWGFLSIRKNPPWAQFRAHNLGFVAHLHYAIWVKPNAFLRFAWAVSVWIGSRKPRHAQDAILQTDLMVRVYRRSNRRTGLCDWAVRKFEERYGGKVADIVAEYIGAPDHPLVKLWRVAG